MRRRDLLLGAGALAAGCSLPFRPAVAEVRSTDGTHEVDFPDTQFTGRPEPDCEQARLWWPDQRNVWTPIGWKDHYFRFNVLYNGTVICEPCPHWTSPRPHARRWLGQSFQLNFTPPFSRGQTSLALPKENTQLWRLDFGHGIQGWREDKETPVLWTEYRLQQGLIVRQEIFAHIPGAGEVVTGIEPIYAWIRLTITYVDSLQAAKDIDFYVQLSKVYYEHDGRYVYEDGVTIDVRPGEASYPKALRAEPLGLQESAGLRVVEPDGKVRMMVSGSSPFALAEASKGVYHLILPLPAKEGAHLDLLVPMLPGESAEAAKEYAMGFDGALAQCEPFWSKRPASLAKVHVPEEHINRAIEHGLKFAQVIAEKDYVNAQYTFLTGSWGYDNLWSTPTSMTSHMFLDLLGYGECVERHMEIFRKFQGTVKPPGPTYEMSPGYFCTPKTLTAYNWLSDNGAILLQASTHALLTNDAAFIQRWTDPIVKSCDFIKNACARTNHNGVKGLLPPAVATDELIPTQAVWSIAWNYKGLTAAVRLLKRIHHPRAEEFARFTDAQKALFARALREHSEQAPQWTDSQGKKHFMVADSFTPNTATHIFDAATYLDTGPLVLVWAGLMDADDELMRSCVQFFREGPSTKLYGYRPDPLDRGVLIHEISTCEPCYSWNNFHSWQRSDRESFLEGMYSLFMGALSQQTLIGCEHRSGVQGNIFPLPMAFTMARLAVIDDELSENELHLLRLCPSAWIRTGEETVFEKMPTIFGRASLKFRLMEKGRNLNVTFCGQWRQRPGKVILHLPPVAGISSITVNGRRHPAKKRTELADV
ncbi:MAG: hypothetical protein ACRD3F_00895 [Acidobacteriaceae bacterium]